MTASTDNVEESDIKFVQWCREAKLKADDDEYVQIYADAAKP